MTNEKIDNQKDQLDTSNLANLGTTSFPNLTPRRGSLPTDYNRPLSPHTPNRLTFNSFSPTLDNFEEEAGNVLDSLLNKNRGYTDNLENVLSGLQDQETNRQVKFRNQQKLLEAREREIQLLETEKEQWLVKEREWIKERINHQQLEKKLTEQNKEIEKLESELKESNDDFYQISEENRKLKQLLNQEKINSQNLAQQLDQEINESNHLKTSQSKINRTLLDKVNELGKLKKINREEKEQWQKIITEQKEKHESEKEQQEQKYAQTINNLRTFQLTADIPSRFQRSHKPNLSTSSLPTSNNSSPRNSYIKNGNLFFELASPSPKKGNIFANELAGSPLSDSDVDPLEQTTRRKRHSNSPLFVRSPSPQESSQSYEDLLNAVDSFATETKEEGENNQELLVENQQLKENQLELERAWKFLADERIEHELLLQRFNEQELLWEKERSEQEQQLKKFNEDKLAEQQRVKEEIAELKYQLAQSNHKIEERTARARQILEEKQEAYNKLDNDLVEISKLVCERDQEIGKMKQEKVMEAKKRKSRKERLINLGKQMDKNGREIEELFFNQQIQVVNIKK